jgi:cytochrome c-type biogenesis protein CcmH/NrfG
VSLRRRASRASLLAGSVLAVALTGLGLGRTLAREGRLPDLHPNALSEGNEALHAGRYAEAAARYRQVVAISPEESNAWFYLGVAGASAGDGDGLRRDYDRAARLSPHMARRLLEGARLARAWRARFRPAGGAP